MAEKGILCGGCYLVDRTKLISHWPQEETVAVITEETHQSGGPGMNLAINIRRLGAAYPIAAMGSIGADDDGRFLMDCCKHHDIDTSGLHILDGVKTSYTDVLTNSTNGRRTFFHSQGANALLSPDHFDLSDVSGHRLLHLGGPGIHTTLDGPWKADENGWVHLFKLARKQGLKTNLELISLPPERIAELGRPCLPHLTSIIINDVEAGALTGLKTTDENGTTDIAAVKEAALQLLNLGIEDFVGVHFPKGSIVVQRGAEPVFQPSVALPADKVVCAVGAGDAFASGLMFGVLEGWDMSKATALAHGAAAVCLGSLSTNETFDSAQQCLGIAEQYGWRESISI